MMSAKMCPEIPVVMYTGWWWLSQYQNQTANMLQNYKTKLYLHMGEWTLSSTNTFDTLSQIFAYPPVDSFKFSGYPDNYFERILMHEFTGQKQSSKQIVYADGSPAPINLSLWNDTPEKLKEFFQEIEVKSIVFNFNEDTHVLETKIYYVIIDLGVSDSVSISVNIEN